MTPIKRLLLAPIIACVFMFGQTEKSSDRTPEQINNLISHYYENPEPRLIPQIFVYIANEMQKTKNPNAILPMAGWLAGTFDANPESLNSTLRELIGIRALDRHIICYAVLLSKHPDRISVVTKMCLDKSFPAEEIREILSTSPKSLLDLPIAGPSDLDMRWGYFMSTGSKEPVLQIIRVLPKDSDKIPEGNVNNSLIIGAANWSLQSNAVQHRRVLEICKSELSKSTKQTGTFLSSIVQEAQKPDNTATP